MSRRIIIRDEAFNDLDRCSAAIGEFAPHTSVRFLEEAQKAFQLIADMPGIGAPRDYNHALRGIRMWPVSRFRNYLVFYVLDDAIEIVRVLHGSQDGQAILTLAEG